MNYIEVCLSVICILLFLIIIILVFKDLKE